MHSSIFLYSYLESHGLISEGLMSRNKSRNSLAVCDFGMSIIKRLSLKQDALGAQYLIVTGSDCWNYTMRCLFCVYSSSSALITEILCTVFRDIFDWNEAQCAFIELTIMCYKQNFKEIVQGVMFPGAGLDKAVGLARGARELVTVRDLNCSERLAVI
ncbi:hypothetical protein C5167_006283 [Papaver somniferum]|uniref:Uncharacterized protein n=1 Tax=Papaver somniferum TaxID=3469 RepID=A0A4Y7JGW6_PAPSO|nr:hypothetical protein C5167_006283 [Papaver somniferum]